MTNSNNKPESKLTPQEQIEAYLDGSLENALGSGLRAGELDVEELRRLQQLINSEPAHAEQVRLEELVRQSVKRAFAPPTVDLSFLDNRKSSLDEAPNESANVSQPNYLKQSDDAPAKRIGGLRKTKWFALAATIAWGAVVGQLFGPGKERQEVAFQQRPLTELYQQCVSEGFEPYWVCDNDYQLAATFHRRQGRALQIEPMPEGQRMVGLSYLAGISRRSTSFLAEIDDQPVIVFIDRADRDWQPPTGSFADSQLHVSRIEKHGLVFYEVSPWEEIRIASYLKPVKGDWRQLANRPTPTPPSTKSEVNVEGK